MQQLAHFLSTSSVLPLALQLAQATAGSAALSAADCKKAPDAVIPASVSASGTKNSPPVVTSKFGKLSDIGKQKSHSAHGINYGGVVNPVDTGHCSGMSKLLSDAVSVVLEAQLCQTHVGRAMQLRRLALWHKVKKLTRVNYFDGVASGAEPALAVLETFDHDQTHAVTSDVKDIELGVIATKQDTCALKDDKLGNLEITKDLQRLNSAAIVHSDQKEDLQNSLPLKSSYGKTKISVFDIAKDSAPDEIKLSCTDASESMGRQNNGQDSSQSLSGRAVVSNLPDRIKGKSLSGTESILEDDCNDNDVCLSPTEINYPYLDASPNGASPSSPQDATASVIDVDSASNDSPDSKLRIDICRDSVLPSAKTQELQSSSTAKRDQLNEAISGIIDEGMTISQVSLKFKVPKPLLCSALRERSLAEVSEKGRLFEEAMVRFSRLATVISEVEVEFENSAGKIGTTDENRTSDVIGNSDENICPNLNCASTENKYADENSTNASKAVGEIGTTAAAADYINSCAPYNKNDVS